MNQTTTLPAGWVRHKPTVGPIYRAFYRHHSKGISVARPWKSQNWVITIDGRGTQSGEFATAEEAIAKTDKVK